MGARQLLNISTEDDLIREISRVISSRTGVQLGEKQRSLVQSRLTRRLRDLKISTPLDYANYLNANETAELAVLTSLLTTHHTFFFREFQHFDFLLKTTLPQIIRAHRASGQKVIRIWSAACSRGQEVYSLAMFLAHHLPTLGPEMSFEVWGSDVDEESVTIAKNGVYSWEELRTAPATYLQGLWSRGSGEIAAYVRAKEELRNRVQFRTVNLMSIDRATFGPQPMTFDAIFCRNVYIYFTQEQIRATTSEMAKYLAPHGHLFLGLSESLNGMNLPFDWVGPSVYAPKSKAIVAEATNVRQLRPVPPVAPQPTTAQLLRVLCVDDSPTILILMKRILTREKGFEIVGTAADGQEAAELARKLRPDVITLDIHMPKVTGVEFLEKFHAELKIPVVMVTSVPREDASLAFRCLELGASDYIEKPSTHNLAMVEEELQFKLRVAFDTTRAPVARIERAQNLALDASFKRPSPILKPAGKLRVIVANFAARDSLLSLLQGFNAPQPPTLVLLEGAGELFETWSEMAAKKLMGGKSIIPKSLVELLPNTIAFAEFEKGTALVMREAKAARTAMLVLGPLSDKSALKIMALPAAHLILEDRGIASPQGLAGRARLIAPITSFVYESDRYFSLLEDS